MRFRGAEPRFSSLPDLLQVGVGGVLVEAALAHGVEAHRAMADHAADVHAFGHAVDRLEGAADNFRAAGIAFEALFTWQDFR